MNPYEPVPMRIARAVVETDDEMLKSFELTFERDADRERFFTTYHPGQFCQLSLFGKGEAPFGVASAAWEGDFVRFTVNRIGLFTRALHDLKPGDPVGLRGPLGNWYPIDDLKGTNIIVIGGGYAFTTLYALTKHLMSPDVRPQYEDLTVVYGARNSGLFLYKNDIETWYEQERLVFHQAVDRPEEGWPHHVGFVPAVTKEIAPPADNAVVFVSGPPVMIRFTLLELHQLGFTSDRIYTSVEKRMKCGIGKCGRCNIGPKYICKDGPVFTQAQLLELPQDL